MPVKQQDAFLDRRTTRAAVSIPPTDSTAPLRRPEGRRRVALGLPAVALALALGACSKAETPAPTAPPPAKVGVLTLQAQSQEISVSLPGRTVASQIAEVRPQVSGIIQKRLFTEGGLVKQGQPLYQIDDAALRATEASAAAALAKAQATQRTAQANAARNAELVKIDAISRQANDESQAAAAQAAAEVAVAKSNLETARINLRYSRIEAPISGRTSLSTVTPGSLVTANQATALTSIVQLDPIHVDFTQSSNELLQLKREWEQGRYARVDGNQMRVRIRLEDGTLYAKEGRVQFAGVIVNPSTGAVTLRAVVPNPDGMLMPGMYVQALLPTGLAPEALLVPQPSVSRDLKGRASVLVVNEENKVERRPIEVDRAIGNRWLVSSGLKAGERVVVDGFQRVKPGDKVDPQPADAKGAGKGAEKGAEKSPEKGSDKSPSAGDKPGTAPATPR
jgi:membrane fusion protein (multidrug efflux system)